MEAQRTLPVSKYAMYKQMRVGWPLLTDLLPFMLILVVVAWPVVLETCAPNHFIEGQTIYRAVHRHFRAKGMIDVAMNGSANLSCVRPPATSAG